MRSPPCSAGFQPAVSPASSRQGYSQFATLGCPPTARIGNSRYSRLEVCATSNRRGHSGVGSAGFQPAVSPASSRQGCSQFAALGCPSTARIGNPRYSRLEVCATSNWRGHSGVGSAGFQPAVSPASSRQGCSQFAALGCPPTAQIGNPRYSRLEVCATELPNSPAPQIIDLILWT